MQKPNLEEERHKLLPKVLNGVRVTPSPKPFLKEKFLYSVRLKDWQSVWMPPAFLPREKPPNIPAYNAYRTYATELIETAQVAFWEIHHDDDWKAKARGKRLSTSDKSIVEHITYLYPELIAEVNGPTELHHLENLNKLNKKVVFRKTLYPGDHDICIRIEKHAAERGSFVKWIEDNLGSENCKVSKLNQYNSWSRFYFYQYIYCSEEDFDKINPFLQMTWPQHIKRLLVSKASLIDK